MPRDPLTKLPADTPAPEERASVMGDVREPQAQPSTLLWACIMIVVAGLLVLGVVRMTSEPEDRAPEPATPPTSIQPAHN